MNRKLLILSSIILFVIIFLLSSCSQNKVLNENGVDDNMMKITSTAFKHNGDIPRKYTCDGDDVNPQLTISGIPKEAKTLVLIMDDPDATKGIWVHWLVWNINSNIKEIPENTLPANSKQGTTDFGGVGYGGPCPGSGKHRYFFKLYALDTNLDLPPITDKAKLEKTMQGHIIAKAELIGLYSRS